MCHERSYQEKRIIAQTPRANQSRKARPGTSESRSTIHMARAKMIAFATKQHFEL